MCHRSLPGFLLFFVLACPSYIHTHARLHTRALTGVRPSKAIVTAVQEKDGGLRQCVRAALFSVKLFWPEGGEERRGEGMAFVNMAGAFAPGVT